MTTLLNQFCDDLNSDFGTTHYLTYFPVGNNLAATPQDIADIRQAFTDVIASNVNVKYGGDLSVIDIDTGTSGNDGLHIKQDADIDTAAGIRYDAFTGEVLTISTAGVPDGTYDSVMWDNAKVIVHNGLVNVENDILQIAVQATLGDTIRGNVYDAAGLPEDGMRIEGVL
jgi:hypothetical protein